MAIINVTSSVDVLNKYRQLIEENLGGDSIYIRTKETINKLKSDGDISDSDRAKIIAEVISSLNTTIVSASMSTALQWANTEKEIELKKLELEKQLDIYDQDKELKKAQADKTKHDMLLVQASNIRENGTATIVDGTVVGLSNDGKAYYQIEKLKEEKLDSVKQREYIDSKIKEANATIHKVIADTYVNFGAYSNYSVTSNGVTGITNITPVGHTTLGDTQKLIAKEQAKGYAYNAWANASQSLSSTIATGLSTETDIFSNNPWILSTWQNTLNNMNTIKVPTI